MTAPETTNSGPVLDGATPVDEAMERYMFLALCLGFNELAKVGRNLGEKMYWRLLRHEATERMLKAGGNCGKDPFAHEPAAVEIYVEGGAMPALRLEKRDVELMRTYVAEHDAREAAK